MSNGSLNTSNNNGYINNSNNIKLPSINNIDKKWKL